MVLRSEQMMGTDFNVSRLERVYHRLQSAVEQGTIPGAAIQVAQHGLTLPPRAFGEMRPGQATQPDTIFLTASVTKPMTVTAVMILVEWGYLLLDDPVHTIIPEFGNRGKEAVTVRHLMTHTSGLPDMLPSNTELRKAHAPLAEFYRQMFDLELDFAPGSHLQYQSCGIAMLAVIVERLSGMSLPDFLHTELFVPLEMKDTALGVRDLPQERIAHVNVSEEIRNADWGWNTAYWWKLGVPWGGMFSTVHNMARCCQMFLNGGELDGVRILSPATVTAMTCDQTSAMPLIPAEERHQQAWGLGWRVMATTAWDAGGNLLSPGSFGHSGSTGTVVWVDPVQEVICVLFTNEPAVNSGRLRGQVSNLVMAAVG